MNKWVKQLIEERAKASELMDAKTANQILDRVRAGDKLVPVELVNRALLETGDLSHRPVN